MPYAIRKIGDSEKPWCVVNTSTDDNKGCSKTEAEAKKHLAVLNMREHGVPEKKESTMDINLDEILKAPPQDITLPREYVERLKTFEQAAEAFLGDRAPTSTPVTEEEPVEKEVQAEEAEVEEKASYTCECLECGHKLVTKEHCSDITCPECGGEMRREDRPGVGKDISENSETATDLQVEQYVGGIAPTPEQMPAPEQKAQTDTSPVDELQLIDKKEIEVETSSARITSAGITKEVSLDQQIEMVRSAFYAEFPTRHDMEDRGPYVREVYSSYLIAEKGGSLFKYPYKQTKEGFDFSDPTAVTMEVNYVEKDISYDQVIRAVRNAFREKFPPDMFPDGAPYVFEVYQDYLIARRKDKTYKYTYEVTDGAIAFGDPVEVEIEVVYHEKKEADSTLAQVKSWVKDIWDKLVKTEEHQELPGLLPLFITKEQSDGSFRWISISNTAFLDREQEIVSTEGVAKSIARADTNHRYGPLLFWHEPITLGTCDFQAQEGVCLVESGIWDSTPLAKAARMGLDTSPTPWGKSIGFLPLAQQEDVVIKGATVRRLWTDLQIVERSILPNSEAASLFTQITTRGLSMEQKKKDALVELLGDEALVDEVLAKAAEINKAASDPDAIVKEADTTPSATEETKESQPEGEKATQTETVDTEVKEAEDTTPTPDAKGNDDALLIAVKTLGTQVEALQLQVKALQEAQSAPRMAIHRPTLASDTADDADTEVLKATSNGEAPRAVKAISAQVLGIGG